MDIVCPQCKTECELEDSHIAVAGTIVRCASCSHMFRVSKRLKSPLPQDKGQVLEEQSLHTPPQTRVWKIRQPGGKLLTCQQLTTLQKWIVEGKVSRDHEISVSGGIWKNLGGIAELSSFFDVYDASLQARASATAQAPSATSDAGTNTAQQQPALRPLSKTTVSASRSSLLPSAASKRARTTKKRGLSKWLGLILLILMLGCGALWYFSVFFS